MNVSEVTMTPALATKLLEGNRANRRLNPRRVKSLATALTGGEYRFDGTPVRQALDGTLLDGQHRLEAIRASGVTVQMLLITDLDPDVQLVLDTGAPRSFTDFLGIHEVANTVNMAAAARLLWQYDSRNVQADRSWSYRPMPTHTQLWAFYGEHRSELETGMVEGTPVRKKIRISPSAATVGYIVLSRVDSEDCDALYAELAFRVAQGPQAALLARTFNARRERSVRDYTQQEQLALLIKTWNLYRKNLNIAKLAWLQSAKKREKFPEPV